MDKGDYVSAQRLKEEFQKNLHNHSDNEKDFLKYFEDRLNLIKDKAGTYLKHKAVLEKLKEFTNQRLDFASLTLRFLEEYERWLADKKRE